MAESTLLDALGDDDLWNIACTVTEMNGGSLFNVRQRECVTAIRASFMNPDAGRDAIAAANAEPVAQSDDRRDKERLDWLDKHAESYGFERIHEGNRWMVDGPFNTVRDAIDASILFELSQQKTQEDGNG